MELRIYNVEDRMTVAAILVKNGYTVRQRAKKRSPGSGTKVYFLEVEDETDNAESK